MNINLVDKFKRLRLRDFIDESKIAPLTNWEYFDEKWIGEANGFTQFLQLEKQPNETQFITLDIQNINNETLWEISEKLNISLDKLTTQQDVIEDFGDSYQKETNDNKITSLIYDLTYFWLNISFSEEDMLVFFKMRIKN